MTEATPDLVVIMTTQSMVEAEVVKAKLRSYGIEAGLRFETIGRLCGVTQNGLAKVEIFVPVSLGNKAKGIIQNS